MSRIPSSCFAMANLSPFQTGYGSLQVFSVYQNVPKGAENDMKLTGLRRDQYTAQALGMFKEEMMDTDFADGSNDSIDFFESGRRFPGRSNNAACSDLCNLASSSKPHVKIHCLDTQTLHLNW